MGQANSQPKKTNWTGVGLLVAATILVVALTTAYLKSNESVVSNSGAAVNPVNTVNGLDPRTGAPPVTTPTELPATVSDASINMLKGGAKKLADYKGKVVVVDLWATWCGPCRQEIPHLIEIANKYKDQGVEVIGLTNEDPVQFGDAVKEFTKQFKINYPIGFADPQLTNSLMRLNGRGGIPQTFVIGRDGKVHGKFIGFHPVISPPQIKEKIESAIKES